MRSNSNEEPKNRIDHSQPKDPKPLLAAMKAGATYYYKDGALVLDFKTIALPDSLKDLLGLPDYLANQARRENELNMKIRQRDYFERTVEHLRDSYGLPVNAINSEKLTIHTTGPLRTTLTHWFREHYFTPGTKPVEEASNVPPQPGTVIKQKISHHKSSRIDQPTPATVKSRSTAQPGMSIPEFLKAVNTLKNESDVMLHAANPLSVEAARDTILTLYRQTAKLAPAPKIAAAVDLAEEVFAAEITDQLSQCTGEARYQAAHQIIDRMLDRIQMPGTISLSSIASTSGFNLRLQKPVTETFGEWKKRTGTLSDILGTLLKDKQENMAINNSGELIVVKMDRQSPAYNVLNGVARQQQTKTLSVY